MNSSKALTDGEYRELLVCLVEGIPNREDISPDAVRAHLKAKKISHQALSLILGMEPKHAIRLLGTQKMIIQTKPFSPTGFIRKNCSV
jgi:hypothetical protein